MPKLLECDTQTSAWAVADAAPAIDWVAEDQFAAGQDLLLQVDSELTIDVHSARTIAINFPAFNDGRALTLAVLVRRNGFSGKLYAVGDIQEELLHYLVRCGFDAIEIADDVSTELALKLLTPYSDHYQGSQIAPKPAFRRGQRG